MKANFRAINVGLGRVNTALVETEVHRTPDRADD